jgi:hypothetical protein
LIRRPVGRPIACIPGRVGRPPSETSAITSAPAKPGTEACSETATSSRARAITITPAICRCISGPGRITISSGTSGHGTGAHGSCSVKSRHIKHLLLWPAAFINGGRLISYAFSVRETPDSLSPAPFSSTGTGSPAGKVLSLSGKTSTGMSARTPAGTLAATRSLASAHSHTS